MMDYSMLDNVDVAEKRFDLPDWMMSEKLYNCGGFSSSYYKDLVSGLFSKVKLFRKKSY